MAKKLKREIVKATGVGLMATVVLAVLIVIGSRSLEHFDAALVGYTFASLAAAFAIAYRYAMWLQRPPTEVYWRRGWLLFFQPHRFLSNVFFLAKQIVMRIGLNDFIWKRGPFRWTAHWLIMWGCFLAAAITFPLVFGWLYFIADPSRIDWYQIVFFGIPVASFHVESLLGELTFHGLVIASLLVIVGVMLAMRRRMRDRDAMVLQSFEEDLLPLILLFSISITGLLLTVSYTWLRGYAYSFLAGLHAITVILTLIWLPFGKFFHIFQRPAQLGVNLYKQIGQSAEQFHCVRCGEPFTSRMHVNDLIDVQNRLGYQYQMPNSSVEHYQHVCPRCRRLLLGVSQGRMWRGRFWPDNAKGIGAAGVDTQEAKRNEP